jgi:hypothetical protein
MHWVDSGAAGTRNKRAGVVRGKETSGGSVAATPTGPTDHIDEKLSEFHSSTTAQFVARATTIVGGSE